MDVRMCNVRLRSRAVRLLVGAVAALLFAPEGAIAQGGPAPAAEAPQNGQWSPRFELSVQTGFDDNPFKMTAGQKADVESGIPRYQDVNSAHDFVTDLRLRGEARGPGLAGRRLRVRGEVRLEGYALSRRRSTLAVGAFVSQKLSKRDEIGVAVEFTPSEFRRNYLVGTDAGGEPEYAAGVARTLEAELEYGRELLRGKRGAPELGLEAALLAKRRTFGEMPWRDRSELGGRVAGDLELLRRFEIGAGVEYGRAFHAGGPEPVSGEAGVTMTALDRDFQQLELEGELGFKLAKRRRLVLSYDWRTRSYLAAPEEDGVYGGRRDRRDRAGAELRLGMGRLVELRLGGALHVQTTLRPGLGDTGDEADYRRTLAFIRVDLPR